MAKCKPSTGFMRHGAGRRRPGAQESRSFAPAAAQGDSTTVVGRKNVGTARNTLLLSNHQSMLDSFLVGIGAWYPQSWWRPHLIPWNPAAAENF